MGQIKVEKTPIEGLYVIEPTVHQDERGYFVETYNQRDFEDAGLYYSFVQDNQSMSVKGVLRGLHFQKEFPQAKLVRVIRGTVFDVAEFCYKVTDFYHPGDEGGIAYNDPDIGIEWPVTDNLIMSHKDQNWPGLSSI